jgi:SAM-dependent methyltransferase
MEDTLMIASIGSIKNHNFNPPWWALYKPYYIIRRNLVRAVAEYASTCKGVILDFGCGMQPYKVLFSHCADYLPVDFATTKDRYYGGGEVIPFDGSQTPLAAESVDHVLCTEVLEHVFEPDLVLAELYRVLKPGGTMLITVPFVWEEHDLPYDYARYSLYGLQHLVERNQFTVIENKRLGSTIETVTQLTIIYLCNWVFPANIIWQRIMTLIVVAPINLLGQLLSKILPKGPSLYQTAVIKVKKT